MLSAFREASAEDARGLQITDPFVAWICGFAAEKSGPGPPLPGNGKEIVCAIIV